MSGLRKAVVMTYFVPDVKPKTLALDITLLVVAFFLLSAPIAKGDSSAVIVPHLDVTLTAVPTDGTTDFVATVHNNSPTAIGTLEMMVFLEANNWHSYDLTINVEDLEPNSMAQVYLRNERETTGTLTELTYAAVERLVVLDTNFNDMALPLQLTFQIGDRKFRLANHGYEYGMP